MIDRPRVAIDAHVLDDKPQGSATVLLNLLRQMAKAAPPFQTVVYCQNVDGVQEAIGRSDFEYRALPQVPALLRLMYIYPRLLKRDAIDLGLFQYIVPPFANTPSAVYVHDILPISHPDLFPLGFRLSRQILFSLSMRRSTAIFTVSNTSKQDIADHFPGLAQRCVVVPNAATFNFFAPSALQFPEPLHTGQKYVLCVGRIEQRKNVHLLAAAFDQAQLSDIKLVIVGSRDMGFEWSPSRAGNVLYFPRLPNDQLQTLYEHAALFVYPSEAEGFGIPLLDALLAGAPVISSNLTSMPEVAGDMARYFDPKSPDAQTRLSDLIRGHFQGDPVRTPTLAERQTLQARYNWHNSARLLIEAINRVLQKQFVAQVVQDAGRHDG